METFVYRLKGVCSQEMRFEIVGGCAGNLLGISRIITDKKISEVISAFEGVRCGIKPTSCPDQISKALLAYAAEHDIKVN